LRKIGVAPGSAARKPLLAAIRAIAEAEALPTPSDYETSFSPGRAHVRRVAGANLWIIYRFDDTHVDVLTVRNEPPVPVDATD
jgi:hypothetical protein